MGVLAFPVAMVVLVGFEIESCKELKIMISSNLCSQFSLYKFWSTGFENDQFQTFTFLTTNHFEKTIIRLPFCSNLMICMKMTCAHPLLS